MRVAVLTVHQSISAGGSLQAYALCKVLRDLGHEVEIISYCPYYFMDFTDSSRRSEWRTPRGFLKKLLNGRRLQKHRGLFDDFAGNYLPPMTKRVNSPEELRDITLDYDAYVCGSDQIWNPPHVHYDTTWFLDFVKSGPRLVSYAASIGRDRLSEKDLGDVMDTLEREPETLRNGRNPERFVPLIRRSCELKAQVVAADERESGIRALLNYGHTFGHAVELLSDFRISHGEGVAIGMCCAGELAVRLGRWSRAEAERQKRAIAALGLATQLPRHCSVPAMLEAMHRDKKNRGGAVTLVLPKRIGEAETVRTVPDSEIASALEVLYD